MREKIVKSKFYPVLMNFLRRKEFINAAEDKNLNFLFRHKIIHKILGPWRWAPCYEYKDLLIPIIFNQELRGIDFGGGRSSISKNTPVVDRLAKINNSIAYENIHEINDKSLDYIYTSHTLEHIMEFNKILSSFQSKLKPEGDLFLIVPAYTCKRWKAGIHKYEDKVGGNQHVVTFSLDDTYTNILSSVQQHFSVKKADYCGDNSIFIHEINS